MRRRLDILLATLCLVIAAALLGMLPTTSSDRGRFERLGTGEIEVRS